MTATKTKRAPAPTHPASPVARTKVSIGQRAKVSTLPTSKAAQASLPRLLRDVFGMSRLREGQQAVIDSILAGRDTLAVMPTGAGKSLCYQLPALLLAGTTIVVSPLIALMKDQVEKLRALDVCVVQLNSSIDSEEEATAMQDIASGQARIVFCTPERLVLPEFLHALQEVKVALLAIDEAHCISQWGHDFRPAYLEMAAAIKALGRPPILALTATAPEAVIADMRQQLHAPDLAVINTGIYRPNLRYRVIQTTNQEERCEQALKLVRESAGVGIVYAATVKAVKEICARLEDAGESVTCYHGKLPARERKENQDLFMAGERRIMVATNAFGMGIDKGDTRFVIHLQMPSNLDAYYQESGRAGRDGENADCTLLFLQDDKRVQQFFLAKHLPAAEELHAIHGAAAQLVQSTHVSFFSFDMLKDTLTDISDGRLKVCLQLLKDGGLLRQDRTLRFTTTKTVPTAEVFASLAEIHHGKQERDRQALETMVSYAQSGACRWKLLLDYFGDDSNFERCCTCDNCISPPLIMQEHLEEEIIVKTPLPASLAAITEGVPKAVVKAITVGSQARVPKYDLGTVLAVEGNKITIEFPDNEVRTFLDEFVTPEPALATLAAAGSMEMASSLEH